MRNMNATTSTNTTDSAAVGARAERVVGPQAHDCRAALVRLVTAYEAHQLLAVPRTYSATSNVGLYLEIDRHHKAQRNAEAELSHALHAAKVALGPNGRAKAGPAAHGDAG